MICANDECSTKQEEVKQDHDETRCREYQVTSDYAWGYVEDINDQNASNNEQIDRTEDSATPERSRSISCGRGVAPDRTLQQAIEGRSTPLFTLGWSRGYIVQLDVRGGRERKIIRQPRTRRQAQQADKGQRKKMVSTAT